MKINVAIKILDEQLSKIQNIQKDDTAWVLQTQDYLKAFFGEKSNYLDFFKEFDFLSQWEYGFEYDPDLTKRKSEASQLLMSCIESLKNIGLQKKPKSNFLSSLSDTALWTILGTILPLLIGLSFYFGKREGEKKVEKLEMDMQKLGDSISLYRQQLNSSVRKTDNSDTSKIK